MVVFEVIRTREFDRKARKIWSAKDLADVVDAVARSPESGAHLGGGLYKVRVPVSGRGKRGGARVIYLLISTRLRIYLLDAYAKNEKNDLSPSEIRVLKRFADSVRGDL